MAYGGASLTRVRTDVQTEDLCGFLKVTNCYFGVVDSLLSNIVVMLRVKDTLLVGGTGSSCRLCSQAEPVMVIADGNSS